MPQILAPALTFAKAALPTTLTLAASTAAYRLYNANELKKRLDTAKEDWSAKLPRLKRAAAIGTALGAGNAFLNSKNAGASAVSAVENAFDKLSVNIARSSAVARKLLTKGLPEATGLLAGSFGGYQLGNAIANKYAPPEDIDLGQRLMSLSSKLGPYADTVGDTAAAFAGFMAGNSVGDKVFKLSDKLKYLRHKNAPAAGGDCYAGGE